METLIALAERLAAVLERADDMLIDHAAQPVVDIASRHLGLSRLVLARLFLWATVLQGAVAATFTHQLSNGPLSRPEILTALFMAALYTHWMLHRITEADRPTASPCLPRYRLDGMPGRAATLVTILSAVLTQLIDGSPAGLVPVLMMWATMITLLFVVYIPACVQGPPHTPFWQTLFKPLFAAAPAPG